jgi:hypothetical protein
MPALLATSFGQIQTMPPVAKAIYFFRKDDYSVWIPCTAKHLSGAQTCASEKYKWGSYQVLHIAQRDEGGAFQIVSRKPDGEMWADVRGQTKP